MVQAGVKKDEVSISGKAGTVFLVDTSAYHKGAHPKSDYRIMAQVQYTNSLFGKPIAASDHKVERAMKSKNEVLQDAAALIRKYAERTGVRFMQNYIWDLRIIARSETRIASLRAYVAGGAACETGATSHKAPLSRGRHRCVSRQ